MSNHRFELFQSNRTSSRVVRRRAGSKRNRRLLFDELEARRVLSATITVDSTTDLADGNTSSIASLIANRGADGVISLREAVIAANHTAGHDTIAFNITGSSVHTIHVGESTPTNTAPSGRGIPSITDPVTIDGYTQGDATPSDPSDDALENTNGTAQGLNADLRIELDGTTAVEGNTHGFDVRSGADGTIIRGLVINRFNGTGIQVLSANHIEISGNFIGTNALGTAAMGNRFGIHLESASENRIGGSTPAQRNLISGNQSTGINVGGSDNIIVGNLIGTDSCGLSSVPNQVGINANGGTHTRIGGTTPQDRNVISGNRDTNANDSAMLGLGVAVGDAELWGNYIGTTAYGDAELGNVTGVSGGHVGGKLPGQGNVISGNFEYGVSGATLVEGNLIGTDATGTAAIPNVTGVFLGAGGNGSVGMVGGTDPAAANVIANNTFFGVRVDSGHYSVLGNSITGNPVIMNLGLVGPGFDRDINDPGDADGGPNDHQNYPVLTSVVSSGSSITVAGNLNSVPNTAFRLEFFSNPSGSLQGETLIGATAVTTNASGDASFSLSFPVAVAVGRFVTSTATDLTLSNTSEFSDSAPVVPLPAFIVTTNSDLADGDTSSINALRANRGADGAISLREAITAANNTPGHDTINFDIPGTGLHTIHVGQLTSDGTNPTGGGLPALSEALTIDGYSQPGSSVNTDPLATNAVLTIELDGSICTTRGLDIRASNCVIRGLVINGFNATQGIWILNSGNVEVSGNFIGTNSLGTAAIRNGFGIHLENAWENTIGGSTPAQRNLISGNRAAGVNTGGSLTRDNVIVGNLIGTDRTGLLSVPNQTGINANDSTHTRIGGTVLADRNIISGNSGIGVAPGSGDLWGNYIGTTVNGDAPLGNSTGVSGGNVGGTLPGQGNLISGNNTGVGFNGDNVRIEGNLIGTDYTGNSPIPNQIGVFAQHVYVGRILGGIDPGARNIISGNDVGIRVDAISTPPASGYYVSVIGNYIGTDISGLSALGNGTGIEFRGSGNLVGGSTSAERNIISGNRGIAVAMGGTVTNFNRISGNYIGVDAAGLNPLGNGAGVIIADAASDNIIGGTNNGEGNIIANSKGFGVLVGRSSPAVTQEAVRNAIIGNSIFGNHQTEPATSSRLGIELRPTPGIAGSDGLQANDSLDADLGPNNLQNHPELSTAAVSGGTTTISGTLPTLPNTTFRVEFFSNASLGTSTYGEGETLLGYIEVTTDADGNAPLSIVVPTAIPVGYIITATATRLMDGLPTDTSEFSVGIPVTPGNTAPSVSANNASVTGSEGAAVSNSGTFSDANLGDDVVITASKGTVTKSGSNSGTWTWSYAGPDDEATNTVTITANDGQGGIATITFQLTVNNANPTATANSYSTAQATAISGNVITDDTGNGADSDPAGANDPVTISGHTDPANGILALNADGSFVYTPDSTFSGTDSFTYTISDGDGGLDTATVIIDVTPAGAGSIVTIPDSCLGGTALLITGTSGADHIVVEPGSTDATLKITINGSQTTVSKPSGRIIVTGGDGDDNIQIAGAVTNPSWLYGDAGNDRLTTGNGGGLLIGGDGNDELLGGNGRDIMVGGQGADRLIGNANDDILIAGLTTKDERGASGHEEFWCEILAVWNSADSFTSRVNNLRNILSPEVVDDFFTDEIDFLNGASGNDWLIFKAGEDRIVGQAEESN